MDKFRERMRIAMSELRISPTVLANRTKISRQTIYCAMNGKCFLRLKTMRMIAEELMKESARQQADMASRIDVLKGISEELNCYSDESCGGGL